MIAVARSPHLVRRLPGLGDPVAREYYQETIRLQSIVKSQANEIEALKEESQRLRDELERIQQCSRDFGMKLVEGACSASDVLRRSTATLTRTT